MSERWWRAYAEARNDPKIQGLPLDMFKAWFNLCCLAAVRDGQIPSALDAALALHMTEAKARAAVAFLAGRNLLDPVPGGYFEPHNWNGRQYKSDVSTDRVKQHRERKRNSQSNGDETFQKRPQIQRQNQKEDDDGDARASGHQCTISPEAFALSDDLMVLQRLDRDDPRCVASAYTAQSWLSKGWKADIIRSTVDIVMSRRPEAPSALRYFEKAIAAAHAEAARPLPVAVVQEEPLHVVRKTIRSRGALDAAADLQRQFEGGPDSSADQGSVISISPGRLCGP